MYSRILSPPKNKSFFLFGPRGTGKTTWVKSKFTKAVYLDLLEAELFGDFFNNSIFVSYGLWQKIEDVKVEYIDALAKTDGKRYAQVAAKLSDPTNK